jgi:hypothetical protein
MFKTANIGNFDRIARIVVGAILASLPYFYASDLWANPLLRWGVPLVGLVLIVTALVRFCPLYRLIGVNTCKIG